MFFESVNCNICGSNKRSIIGEPRLTGETTDILKSVNIVVVRCSKCGFYYISPMIYFDKEDISYLYDRHYFDGTKATDWWIEKRRLDRIERLDGLERYRHGKISRFLDIGCGEGYVLEEGAVRKWDVYGQDVSDNLAPAIKAQTEIAFSEGNLKDIDYPDNYFDAIYLDSVLEHVQQPTELLLEVNRILNYNGVVYIGVPNERSLDIQLRNLICKVKRRGICANLNPLQNPYHIVGFTPSALSKLALRTGFAIRHLRTFGGVAEFRKCDFKLQTRGFLGNFALAPICFVGLITNRGHYIEVYLIKNRNI